VIWKFEKNGTFSVKSTYNALTNCDGGQPFKHIWKSKIPAKIKIFLWSVANEAILTKDNLLKRRWRGDPLCYFCHQPETTNHLLFTCSTARSYGLLFPLASGQLIFLLALNRAGGGVRGGFLMETNFMLLALQLSVGPFGKCGIRYALTGKSFIILLK